MAEIVSEKQTLSLKLQQCKKGPVDPDQRYCIQKHGEFLIEQISDCVDIVDRLFSKFVLSKDDKDRIVGKSTAKDRTRELRDTLMERTPHGFDQFLEALNDLGYEQVYLTLQEELNNQKSASETSRHDSQSDGDPPATPELENVASAGLSSSVSASEFQEKFDLVNARQDQTDQKVDDHENRLVSVEKVVELNKIIEDQHKEINQLKQQLQDAQKKYNYYVQLAEQSQQQADKAYRKIQDQAKMIRELEFKIQEKERVLNAKIQEQEKLLKANDSEIKTLKKYQTESETKLRNLDDKLKKANSKVTELEKQRAADRRQMTKQLQAQARQIEQIRHQADLRQHANDQKMTALVEQKLEEMFASKAARPPGQRPNNTQSTHRAVLPNEGNRRASKDKLQLPNMSSASVARGKAEIYSKPQTKVSWDGRSVKSATVKW